MERYGSAMATLDAEVDRARTSEVGNTEEEDEVRSILQRMCLVERLHRHQEGVLDAVFWACDPCTRKCLDTFARVGDKFPLSPSPETASKDTRNAGGEGNCCQGFGSRLLTPFELLILRSR